MDRLSKIEEIKAALLREINKRRVDQGKAPLAKYPEEGCTVCGDGKDSVGPLIPRAVQYMRTCQRCALLHFPFSKLRLPAGETITWFTSNPTFHRTSDYGIMLSDSALYLYAPLWLVLFLRWRRIPLTSIRGIEFRDSRVFPSLRIQLAHGVAVLRTPLDYADEMNFDRRNLREAAERVSASLHHGEVE